MPTERDARVREICLLLLYLGLGIACGVLWARYPSLEQTSWGNVPRLYSWHQEMVTGHAPTPNQYRPLIPWLAEGLRRLSGGDLLTIYAFLRALFTGLGLWLLDRYLRRWFTPAAATAGALFLAAITPFTYYAVVQESDPLNLAILLAAFWALTYERDMLLFPLVLVGTLNRETTWMIPAVYLLARWDAKRSVPVLLRAGALAVCWAAVYSGLHLLWPSAQHPNYTKFIMWPDNVASLLPTLYALVFLGLLWFLPWVAGKQAPALPRRALWLVPPFVVLHYIVAVVLEVRLFLPLVPILLPLTWWVLFPEARLPEPAPVEAPPRLKARR